MGDEIAPCPVQCLGHRGGKYLFISRSGEIREVLAKDLTTNGILDLCGEDWLLQNFGRVDRDGNATKEFNARRAAAWLIEGCHKEGLLDIDAAQLRGIGCWPGDKLDDPLVCNWGDCLMIAPFNETDDPVRTFEDSANITIGDGSTIVWKPAGVRRGKAIYPRAPDVARPGGPPLTSDQVKEIARAFTRWNYSSPLEQSSCLVLLSSQHSGPRRDGA